MLPPGDPPPPPAEPRGSNRPWHWLSPWSLDDDDAGTDIWYRWPRAASPSAKGRRTGRKARNAARPAPPAARAGSPALPEPEGGRALPEAAAGAAFDQPVTAPSPLPLRAQLNKRSITGWLGLIFLWIGMLGFVFLVWVYVQEMPHETDEDLRIQLPVDQAPATQAPGRLRSLLDSLVPAKHTAQPPASPWDWDTPSLSRFVTANGTTLDNLRDLLEDADWHPHQSLWQARDLGAHPAWPHLTLLMVAETAYLSRRADEDAAFTAVIDMAELSRRLQDIWAWPSFMRRAYDLHTACTQAAAILLQRTRLDGERLRHFQTEFNHCRPDQSLLREALNAYYTHEKNGLLGSAGGEVPGASAPRRTSRLLFKTKDTLSLFAHAFRDLKNETATPRFASVSHAGSLRRSQNRSFYRPNSAGEKFFDQRMAAYLDLPETHSLAEARHLLIVNFFAIRRYHADHLSWPPTLEALRPKYLDRLLIDPFSGESFRYEPAKGLMFSVGRDLLPQSGSHPNPSPADPEEPAVALTAPPNQ